MVASLAPLAEPKEDKASLAMRSPSHLTSLSLSLNSRSALPIVCKSYVESELLIYHIDIPLIQLQGEGEVLQLCPRKKNFQKIFEYEFKNGRFIVKSKVRKIPDAFDFDKIRERIANLSKKREELEVEKKKKSSAADWVIASLITVFVGAVWSLLLFSS